MVKQSSQPQPFIFTQLHSDSEALFFFLLVIFVLTLVFFLVFQCAAVPQWAWKSSPWTKRHWWWAGNALWLSTTRPSPVTWSPTAGWNVMLPMRRPSPRRETRAWWVWLSAALTADRYQTTAVCQNRLHYFSFIKMDVVHTALIGLSRMRLFGSEGGCISDSVQRRWQVVMNSACVCAAVGWYEGPDALMSLTCLRLDTWDSHIDESNCNVLTTTPLGFFC